LKVIITFHGVTLGAYFSQARSFSLVSEEATSLD